MTATTPTPERRRLRAQTVTRPEELAPHLGDWDALAVAGGQPFSAPAWMLSWWQHGRSGDARLRVVLVHDDDGLAGVGPFFAQIGPLGLAEYRLLAAGFCHRIGPLARSGSESDVAAAIAHELAAADPRPASVVFEGVDAQDPWPELLRARWPSRVRPQLRTDVEMDAPSIELGGDYEAWMSRRDRKFRKEARRTARRLEDEGVTTRIATDADAVDALLSLHAARWAERGGSNVGEEARRVVVAAAEQLGPDSRLGVALLESPDGPVAAELVLRAGDRLVFWSGGFDPAWAKHAPGTQAMLLALADAAGTGVVLADLGGGAHEYKRRMADGNRPLVWRTLFPPGRLYLPIRLRNVPKHVRYGLRRRLRALPPERQQQARDAIARVRRITARVGR